MTVEYFGIEAVTTAPSVFNPPSKCVSYFSNYNYFHYISLTKEILVDGVKCQKDRTTYYNAATEI